MRTIRRALTLALLLGATPATAQLPPDAAWRTLDSEHTRVTFMPGLEPLARRAAEAAERSWALLEASLAPAPGGKIDIILADNVDFSNGSATPVPSNRIIVYARPPVDDEALAFNGAWIDLVVSHEMAHIFHLDRTGGFGRFVRAIFGRIPLLWPVFPALGTPGWSIEGLAVTVESAYTGFGRLHGSFHDMVVRTAVLENRFDRMDRLNESSPIWPGDQRVYIYGSLFMHWLEERYGADVHRELLDRTASAFLPPFLFFDQVAKRTFDASFDEAFEEWRADLQQSYGARADSLRAEGLTEVESLTTHGRWAVHPRVSPDGRRIAYAAETGARVTATRVIDLETGALLEVHDANGIGALDWMPDGRAIVRATFEFDGPWSIHRDLERIGAGGRRLTDGARIEQPDVAADGERIVAVRNGHGTNELVLVHASTGAITPIGSAQADVQWAFPRWSPDGRRIAVSRVTGDGRYDIVILDANGGELLRVTDDAAIDASPAWSPDGRWIVFFSDRSGIPNLYAADVQTPGAPALRQVTNVVTGALYPDVSPDGRWIVFSAYHADGFSIARIPFDPAAWRDPAPLRLHAHPVAAGGSGAPLATAPVQTGETRAYSGLRSMLPTYWIPFGGEVTDAGRFLGLSTSGSDLVGRHGTAAYAAVDIDGSGRWIGGFGYSWAGLGNPILSLELSRDWDRLGSVLAPDSTVRVALGREDVAGVFARFVRRRWRSSASVSIGLERERFRRVLLGQPKFRFEDDVDRLWNVVGRVSYANTRTSSFAVSREDGIALSLEARTTLDSDGGDGVPREYSELELFSAAYKRLPFRSFAHHVLALRGSALLRSGDGATPTSIGGGSGGAADLAGINIGGGSRFLPVRGFDRGVLVGNRAWTATAEYRLPIALLGRRPSLSPVYFDRISAAAFLDAGDAECTGRAAEVFRSCARADSVASPLLGTGAELVLDIGFAGIFPARVRTGFAVPVRGPDGSVTFYVHLGSNF